MLPASRVDRCAHCCFNNEFFHDQGSYSAYLGFVGNQARPALLYARGAAGCRVMTRHVTNLAFLPSFTALDSPTNPTKMRRGMQSRAKQELCGRMAFGFGDPIGSSDLQPRICGHL